MAAKRLSGAGLFSSLELQPRPGRRSGHPGDQREHARAERAGCRRRSSEQAGTAFQAAVRAGPAKAQDVLGALPIDDTDTDTDTDADADADAVSDPHACLANRL